MVPLHFAANRSLTTSLPVPKCNRPKVNLGVNRNISQTPPILKGRRDTLSFLTSLLCKHIIAHRWWILTTLISVLYKHRMMFHWACYSGSLCLFRHFRGWSQHRAVGFRNMVSKWRNRCICGSVPRPQVPKCWTPEAEQHSTYLRGQERPWVLEPAEQTTMWDFSSLHGSQGDQLMA